MNTMHTNDAMCLDLVEHAKKLYEESGRDSVELEATGKAVGYCNAARSNGEFYEAMGDAMRSELVFLAPYKKLGIIND